MILLLEDDADRLTRFRTVVPRIDACLELQHWSDARAMIREIERYLPQARLVSLDHDLEPGEESAGTDPGDGLEVAKFLAALPPACPVIIHSSNSQRSLWMAGEFELGGWYCRRVAPIGEDWIERDWRHLARKLLRRTQRSSGDSALA